jgi:hypothetical protein
MLVAYVSALSQGERCFDSAFYNQANRWVCRVAANAVGGAAASGPLLEQSYS